jgi:hypothetical protein
MRAGTVHVSVLEPVATETWSQHGLDSHIAAVRDRFVAVLAAGAQRGDA